MKENLVYQQPNRLQQEFEAKNDLLRSRFFEISPYDYLSIIFPDKGEEDNLIVVLGTIKDKKGNVVEKGTVMRVKLEDLWKIM